MPIEEKLSLRRGKYFQVECDFISRLSVIFLGDSLCMYQCVLISNLIQLSYVVLFKRG